MKAESRERKEKSRTDVGGRGRSSRKIGVSCRRGTQKEVETDSGEVKKGRGYWE